MTPEERRRIIAELDADERVALDALDEAVVRLRLAAATATGCWNRWREKRRKCDLIDRGGPVNEA